MLRATIIASVYMKVVVACVVLQGGLSLIVEDQVLKKITNTCSSPDSRNIVVEIENNTDTELHLLTYRLESRNKSAR